MLEGRKLSVSRSNLSAAIAEENQKKEEHAAKKRRKGACARGSLRRVAQCGTRGDPGPVCVQRRARAGPARRPSRGCSDYRCACLAAPALFAARRSSFLTCGPAAQRALRGNAALGSGGGGPAKSNAEFAALFKKKEPPPG